ncbi:cytochrome b [Sulfitobacter guttiformis]|uniref:Cytochrome b561 n=1 Tax=Sulfitobacter guttiformis TaxID=74349 RepID=A0A420DTB3_9RHOB|nr:cytochrome b [Sulfitobacter guttiformis]KIN71092.1 Cytochrome B561 [Sulfitobacter guttiformis KCTC 32187]RKE97574.1 cytochrome b561 [Sulfitobacter guttiformis]
MTNPSLSYTFAARLMHWSMAALVLVMVPVGFLMVQQGLPRPLQNTLFIFHKNIGVLLLVMIVLRILYRWRRPPPPSDLPLWQASIAKLTHAALYALLFVMPLAGYIRVRAGGFPIEALDAAGIPAIIPKSEALAGFAKAVHFYGAWAIAILIGLHIAAAFHHALIKRDGVMARMWPPRE